MISNAHNLETVCLTDCPKVHSSVLAECENAQQYIEQITVMIEARATASPEQLDPYSTALLRLKNDLERAIAPITKDADTCTCESSEKGIPSECFEQNLLTASDIRWLCSQCDYYFSLSMPLVGSVQSSQTRSPQKRKQWQIRAVRRTLGYLRAIAMVRRLL